MEAVAVYSDADAGAVHVRLADIAVRIGPAPPAESYLRIDAIVEAALATGAEAIHPGYGFLAERAAFARAVEDAGLVFVGPPSAVDRRARRQARGARDLARSAGVEGVPGTLEPVAVDRPDGLDAIIAEAERIGFPLLVKAAAGGGGRGMRRVAEPGRAARRRWPPDRPRRRRRLATARSTSSARSVPPGTSKSSCWATRRARSWRSASGTARSSVATRSSSRRRRHRG